MLYRCLAALVVLIHAAFIMFVVIGGFLAWRWRWLAWVHVPTAIWGVLIEFQGWVCPLTPLENYLRHRAGVAGYHGGFIEHYVLPIIYPAHMTPRLQIVLGIFVIVVNLVAYAGFVMRGARG